MLDPNYMHIIAITVGGLAAYIAIVFMISKAMGRPELSAYARIETQQLLISAIILVIAFAAWEFTGAMTQGIAGKGVMEAPLEFLNLVINKGILPMYTKLVRMEVMMGYFNAIEYRMGPGVWNWITKAVPGLEPLISIVRMLIFTFTALYGTFSVQVIIFSILPALVYPYLLPAGIVLRFFPPTRDAGVYLIALCIAFSSIFPIMYALNYASLSQMWVAHGWVDDEPGDTEYTPDIEDTSYFAGVNGALGTATTVFEQQISSRLPVFQPFSFATLVPFLDRVAQISLSGLFLPALSMTITIAMVNAVTKFVTGKG